MTKEHRKKAYLVLSDGTVFQGWGFGYETTVTGEVVFNTALTGYQEILTDPSYQGQMIVMTYPQIGNVGVNLNDDESQKIFASGLIIKELSPCVSNYRSEKDLNTFLQEQKRPGLFGIDTRQLVRHIRESGAMPAVLSNDGTNLAQLKKKVKSVSEMMGQNLAKEVSCEKPYRFQKRLVDFIKTQPLQHRHNMNTKKVVAYDFGVKKNILRLLVESGCSVQVVPHDTPAEVILDDPSIDGVFLSNGPGDPAACVKEIMTVKKFIGYLPVFGICLGHQILAHALKAETFKLKFGHHGANHPVKNLNSGHVEITSQNHGFAVKEKTLPKDLEVTHRHLNDGTIAGLKHKTLPVFSVQYHPEAAPGPHDSRYLFQEFVENMNRREKHA